ncbi:MAG TPA: HAMP domain-containing sensor histidine kinase [Rhodocyclaceae bacterium]|nr:HAMP domain-containing sensor histidine kinase [Rhodocyclaceae bacterium]
MARLRLLPASPFIRFAVAMPLVIACIVAGVFYPLYREAEKHIRDEVHAAIEQEIFALDDHFHDLGIEALSKEIGDRVASPIDPDAVYLLMDRNGQVVAGNLRTWPDGVPTQDDTWFRVQGEDQRYIEGKVFVLYGEQRLLVGRRSPLAAFRQSMTRRLAWSAALIVLAAALLVSAFSQRIRRRLQSLAEHARAIQEGHLSRRLPIGQDNDELDELAANFNRAFDEIERLVEGTRHISSALAHDMRRPLIALRNSLEAALEETGDGAPVSGTLLRLVDQTETLLHTFAALLRLARLESGGLAPADAPCRLDDIARDVAELYAAVAEQQQRSLVTRLESCSIRGDRELLFQLVLNLIENALHHGAGTISITVAPDGQNARIRVSDEGAGVPGTALDKLFDRFYQVDASRTEGTGSGIGLALVRGIAQAHGGSARAINLDSGFAVEVRIPLAAT